MELSSLAAEIVLFMNVQIIVITELSTDVLCPTLLTTCYELKHTMFIRPLVTINAAEVVPVIFHTAVPFASTGEVEASPRLNFFRLVNFSQAICTSQVTLSKHVNGRFHRIPVGSTFTA
jgi:hypothetical protein